MNLTVEVAGWTFEISLAYGESEGDDDESRTHAGAADRGLDLSTDRADRRGPDYDAGTVIEQEDRRTGFHA